MAIEVMNDAMLECTGRVVLKPHEEKRLLQGHRWIYSNEIEHVEGEDTHGSVVEIVRHDGRLVGRGFYNANSLIAIRILTMKKERVDRPFFAERIRRAMDRRLRWYRDLSSYRLVHGESDDLPGLIIDKYADYLVLQTFCLGMDRIKDVICDVLEEILHPGGIMERNGSYLRLREGLPSRCGVLRGNIPEKITIEECDLRFEVDVVSGQKTGFFFDQRDNRVLMRRYTSGARVLDVYCNDGAFSLHAVKGGASAVLGIDVASESIDRARNNALLNTLEDHCQFEVMEAGRGMESLRQQGEKFDVVILDPPAFTKTRKNVSAARRGYEDVNGKAMRLLRAGGILATSSCSFHITEETFLRCVQMAANKAHRGLRQFEWHTQAADHPVLPAMPETKYLKFGVFQVD